MKDQSRRHGTDTNGELSSASDHNVFAEPELSVDEIVELKKRLSLDTDVNAAPRVISYMVASMLEDVPRSTQRSSVDLARHVGFLSASWGMHLQSALSMPGSDWPESMTPPETFADALSEVSRP